MADEEPLLKAISEGNFPDVADRYRLIDNNAINVLVRYDGETFERLVDELHEDKPRMPGFLRRWMRRATPHAIGLFRPPDHAALWNHLEPVQFGRWRKPTHGMQLGSSRRLPSSTTHYLALQNRSSQNHGLPDFASHNLCRKGETNMAEDCPKTHILEVWGDFACLCPEMKVERYSYPCPTPRARGVFEAIYFKPEFRWQVTRIELLAPPAYIALRRNEVKDKANVAAIQKWIAGKAAPEPLWADADKTSLGTDMKGRTQRQTMALRNPRYRLSAHIVPRPGKQSQQTAYDQQFARRASQGKCFQNRTFGCREFVAFFRYIDSWPTSARPNPTTRILAGCSTTSTIWIRLTTTRVRLSSASFACLENGVLEVPPYDSDAVRNRKGGPADAPCHCRLRTQTAGQGTGQDRAQTEGGGWLIVVSPRGEFLRVFDTTGGEKCGKPRVFKACPDLSAEPLGSEFDRWSRNGGGNPASS